MDKQESGAGDQGQCSHVGSGSNDWKTAHRELVRLARCRADQDFDEGTWLLTARRSEAHLRLGYGSFAEYVERLFGYAPRLTHEKLRVAEALEKLPEMARLLRQGQTSWSALRELTRVATPATEHEWLAVSQDLTVREVERLVSGHRLGSRPRDPVDAAAVRHVLRFEVSGDVLATFREALTKIRRDAGQHVNDDAALLLMARHVLGGPTDDGRASYQVALTVCKGCRQACIEGGGESVSIGQDLMAMAECDAQYIGSVAESPHVGKLTAQPPEVSELALAHEKTPRTTPLRAAQEIPPAVRRFVLRRDSHRCVIPGCRHATFVDVHHIDARADRGTHDPQNLVALCSAHHRAVHRGKLILDGSASALRARHADGTGYGGCVMPSELETNTRAFRALRKLGFGEKEVRRALDHVRARGGSGGTHVGKTSIDQANGPSQKHPAAGSVERMIRAALQELTRTRLALAG